jgi:hypothetical protein
MTLFFESATSISHFLSPMGREAVHEECVGLRMGEKVTVNLVRGEGSRRTSATASARRLARYSCIHPIALSSRRTVDEIGDVIFKFELEDAIRRN